MTNGNSDNPARKKSARRRWIIILGLLIAVALLRLIGFMIAADAKRKEEARLEAKGVITKLHEAISLFQAEWNRYPIPSSVCPL